jgi:hypothetical protein
MCEIPGKRNKMKSRKPETETKSKYQLKAEEEEAFKSHVLKRKKQTAPRIKVESPGNQTVLSYDHPDSVTGQVLLMEACTAARF